MKNWHVRKFACITSLLAIALYNPLAAGAKQPASKDYVFQGEWSGSCLNPRSTDYIENIIFKKGKNFKANRYNYYGEYFYHGNYEIEKVGEANYIVKLYNLTSKEVDMPLKTSLYIRTITEDIFLTDKDIECAYFSK